MYNHHVRNMVANLVESNIVSEDNEEAAAEVMRRYWIEKIAIVWQIGDIMPRAKLTYRQGIRVLELIHENQNSEFGVNWAVIDATIQEVLDSDGPDVF